MENLNLLQQFTKCEADEKNNVFTIFYPCYIVLFDLSMVKIIDTNFTVSVKHGTFHLKYFKNGSAPSIHVI